MTLSGSGALGAQAMEQQRGRSRTKERTRGDREGSPCQLLTAESHVPLTFFNVPVGTRQNAAQPATPSEQQDSAQTSPRDVKTTTPPMAATEEGSPAFHTARDYTDKCGLWGPSPSDTCLTPHLHRTASPGPQTPVPEMSPSCSSGSGDTGASPDGRSALAEAAEDEEEAEAKWGSEEEAQDSITAMSRAVKALAVRTAALRRTSVRQRRDLRTTRQGEDAESPLGVVSPAPLAPVGEAGILLQDLPIAGVSVYRGRCVPLL